MQTKPNGWFYAVRYENLKLKQSEKANQLGISSAVLQRYRNGTNLLLPYRIQPNNTSKQAKKTSNTNFNNGSHREPDIKRPQMTSNDLKATQTTAKSNRKNKNILKAGSTLENIGINEQYLYEILDNKDKWMDLAMQKISTDKTVRSDTIEDLKDFNSNS